jgi:stringent starvation protein A
MAVANKRSVMILYTGSKDIESHRTRIVLAEKGVQVDIIEVDRYDEVEDLRDLNPYNTVPTLVDRNLVLYRAPIIMEYLDERFPHPPLLPVYPIARAKSRLMMFRIEHDWYTLIHAILDGKEKIVAKAKKDLQEALVSVAPFFEDSTYFMGNDFSLIDCSVAPILWRLSHLGIELPKDHAKAILDYAQRVFARDSFQSSLTEAERELNMDLG